MTEQAGDYNAGHSDIGTLAGEMAIVKAEADNAYARYHKLEYQLITALRERYPEEWSRWERSISSFKAEGVSIPVSRAYDIEKVRAELGEEMPELIVTETKTTEKVDGRKMAQLWKDAAFARRLEKTLLPPVPKVKVTG